MSNNSSDNSFVWLIAGVIFVAAMIAQLFSGNSSTVSSSPSSGSVEHRYVRERFKQEGFSNSDAETAAKAVIRFHEAQQRNAR